MGRQEARRALSATSVGVIAALAGFAASTGHARDEAPLFVADVWSLDVGTQDPALLSASSCRSCHEEEHGTWSRSRHARAYSNRIFAADFARTPRRWCLACHAPLAAQQAEILGGRAGALAGDGVGCAVCHVRDGVVLSARAATVQGDRAHAMRVDTRLSSPKLCSACHQFAAPVPHARPTRAGDVAMQDTHAEWRSSSFGARGITCQRCHMPNGDHTNPGAHDGDFLADSVTVSVVLTGPRSVTVTAQTHGVGHAFPTGDPSRALRVDLCADDACEVPFTGTSFMRSFRERDGRYALTEDTTVPPPTNVNGTAQRTIRLTLSPEDPAPRAFRAIYRYAPHLTSALGKDATERVLQRGLVATP